MMPVHRSQKVRLHQESLSLQHYLHLYLHPFGTFDNPLQKVLPYNRICNRIILLPLFSNPNFSFNQFIPTKRKKEKRETNLNTYKMQINKPATNIFRHNRVIRTTKYETSTDVQELTMNELIRELQNLGSYFARTKRTE